MSTVIALLGAGEPVIANVMKGRHFVLVVGSTDDDTLVVHDSGFNRTTYSISSDVVGWRLFNMTSVSSFLRGSR
jgi:hypothetical protein